MGKGQKRRVGDRGQVTIPKKIREEFGIGGGDEVEIRKESGRIVIEKPITRADLAAGYRARADHVRELTDEMGGVSQEANESLGDVPEWE